MTETETKRNPKKLKGTVVSTDMDKTVVVMIDRFEKHPKYLKYVKKKSKQLAHDPENKASVGDSVVIEESRPISKKKRFILKEIRN